MRSRTDARRAIRRVRLVGFHNLVDETIEVSGGGHLFLLGDNGSGKTTVLDAIHLVLTGAFDVELNAAARAFGRREPGRSLAGIVLRHDAERGVVHQRGATAYAALELSGEGDDGAITIGVGLEATTMDAQVTRWGFVRRGGLDGLALVTEVPGGVRAKTREELRGALGKSDVFLRMTEYRRALAERFFGGESAYEEMCRLWGMAKSYREIVQGARDFAGLFERLLPGPDRAVLGDIWDSLRRLAELEASIRALEEQRAYVAGVAELVRAIAVHREEIARFRWLGLTWERRELAERAAAFAVAIRAAQRELDAACAEVESARASREDADRAVRAVESEEGTALALGLREGERELARLARELSTAGSEHAARERRHESERELHGAAVDAFFERWSALAGAAAVAIEDASRLPSLLPRAMACVEAERRAGAGRATTALPPVDEGARVELDAVLEAARLRAREAVLAAEAREREVERAQASLDALASRAEPGVDPRDLRARAALDRAGIEVSALFELVEPHAAAVEDVLAKVEALVGDALLGALITREEDAERACAILAEHAGARVVARAIPAAALPEWIARALVVPRTPRELRAHAVLAAALAGAGVLGDAVELRGVAWLGTARPARLLGERARRRAHAERLAEATAALASAERTSSSAAAPVRATAEALARIERAVERFGGLRSAALFDAQRACSERARDLAHAAERRAESERALREAEGRARESARALDALRARVAVDGAAGDAAERLAAQLEAKLAELRRALTEATARAEAVTERRVRGAAALAGLESEANAVRAAMEALDVRLAAADEELRRAAARSGGAGSVDGFESRPAIERALDLATRNEHARCEELLGDGSRGLRRIAFAGRFGLGLDRGALRVEDRRGASVESLLAELDVALGESREAFGERTRELLDTLVMGALVRELQGQVERLHETVLELNRLLGGLELGASRYRFRVVPRPERAELVTLVRRMSALDPQSRAELRAYLDERRGELAGGEGRTDLFDYRRWFDYRLVIRRADRGAAPIEVAPNEQEETELTREVRALGSGGEQGVPNYLLVIALAKLGYDAASARVRPLLFDEAFQGIDAARRDALLRFATELGLQLVIASPDQDGVTPAVRCATTLFVLKDERGDVHLAPYHFETRGGGRQGVLDLGASAPGEITP